MFGQELNEEGNIIDIDKDEGLAISMVTEIIEPRQMNYDEAREMVKVELERKLKLESALKKAKKIKELSSSNKKINEIANDFSLEVRGVKPFSRALPDNSELPIPLISKIFDSKLGEINFEKRGGAEIVVAQTAQIINKLAEDKSEIKKFTQKIKEDISMDLLAQFSEALRKKYKITINDDVIDQLN